MSGDGERLRHALSLAPHASRAHPTAEHFWPLLVAAGAAQPMQPVTVIDGGVTYAVLSMQWEKPAPDTIDLLRDYFGPERHRLVEPAGFLAAAGAPVAFGSDWPVDALDEWFALKVGVTRTAAAGAPAKYAGRLGEDPGLTRLQVLRAATIVAARELHADTTVGSLERGKLADLIVLDRDPLSIPAEDIARVQVLRTVVGGRVVYEAQAAAH